MELDYRKLALPPELLRTLEALGFERLTPIQALSLPALRAGKDVIGESRTGSGKTLAFGLPLLEKIRSEERLLQGLVLCPTRELSEQVTRTLRSAGRFKKDLNVVSLVGGEPIFHQIRSLQHGAHIVVGTPGRLLDLIGRGKLVLGSVHTVVLDEADRMLDMGFFDAVREILEKTPKSRQTALFSATFPAEIESLSRRFQRTPERLIVETAPSEVPAIEEVAYHVKEDSRLETLVRLLARHRFESALVFCGRKVTVDEVANALGRAGLRAGKIHGDLEQCDRDRVMACFRNGTIRVLVATDVAARGLDIEGLDAVVNYEMAKDADTHVHRIGRTGRAGKTGLAISLWSDQEKWRLDRLAEERDRSIAAGTERGAGANAAFPAELATLEIGGGRKDKLRPGDILGALTGEGSNLPGTSIGKIEIRDRVAFVAVARPVVRDALKSLQQGRIKGRRFPVALLSILD